MRAARRDVAEVMSLEFQHDPAGCLGGNRIRRAFLVGGLEIGAVDAAVDIHPPPVTLSSGVARIADRDVDVAVDDAGIGVVAEEITAVDGLTGVVVERKVDVAVDDDRSDRQIQDVHRADPRNSRAVELAVAVAALAEIVRVDVDVAVDGSARRGAGNGVEGGVDQLDLNGMFFAGNPVDGAAGAVDRVVGVDAVPENSVELTVGEGEFDAAVDVEAAALVPDHDAHNAGGRVIADQRSRHIDERPLDAGMDHGIAAVFHQEPDREMILPEIDAAERHIDSAGDLHASGVSGLRRIVGGAGDPAARDDIPPGAGECGVCEVDDDAAGDGVPFVRIDRAAVIGDFAAAGEIAGDGDRSVFRAAAADDDASCDGRNRFARIGVKEAADERIRDRFSRQDFGDEVPDGGRSVAFGRQAGISGRAKLNRVRQRIAAGLCAGGRDGCGDCRRKRSFVPVFRFRFRRRRGDGCRGFGIAGGGAPGIAVGGAGAERHRRALLCLRGVAPGIFRQCPRPAARQPVLHLFPRRIARRTA